MAAFAFTAVDMDVVEVDSAFLSLLRYVLSEELSHYRFARSNFPCHQHALGHFARSLYGESEKLVKYLQVRFSVG